MLAMQSIFDRARGEAGSRAARGFEQIVQRESPRQGGRDVRRLKSFGITRFLLFRGAKSRSEIVATLWRCWQSRQVIQRGRRDRLHGTASRTHRETFTL